MARGSTDETRNELEISRVARSWGSNPTRRDLLKALAAGVIAIAPARLGIAASEPKRVEFAVVGAGLFGASAAMHLAAAGTRSVALIGPSELVGSSSPAQQLASHYDESRNATAMDADPTWAALARSSVAPLRRLEERTGLEILSEVGSLRVTQGRLADGYFDLPGIRKVAAELGVGLVDLSAAGLAARYPDARFGPDSVGLLQETEAGLISPRRLVRALRQVAVEEGASWIDAEVSRIEPQADFVDVVLAEGTRVRAQRVLVATGAAPLGRSLLADPSRASVHAHSPTHVEVADDFETTLPPAMITNTDGAEFFGGFVAPPIRYADGRRYVKVVGQVVDLADGKPVPDQTAGAVRAAKRILPSLEPGVVRSQVCMTSDTEDGRPIIDWVDSRMLVALAGNGKGAKAALEIGRIAADRIAAPPPPRVQETETSP